MNFNNILKSLVAGAVMLVGWACTDEIQYNPTPQPEGDQVFFTEDPSSVQIPENATSLPFELKRVVTAGTVSVPVTGSVTDAEGNPVEDIFTFPEEVTFADGEALATYNVGVDYSKVVAETDYYITLAISGAEVSPYGTTELSFTASYAPWTDWVPYSESDPLYEGVTGPPLDGEALLDTVWVCKSLINPNLEKYRFPAYLYTNFYFDYDITVDKSSTYTINGETVYQATMPLTDTHFVYTNGVTMAYIDFYTFLIQYMGYTPERANQYLLGEGIPSYFNERTGTFYIYIFGVDKANPANLNNAFGDGYTVLQLPGFASYSFTFNMLGNYIDTTGAESAVVQIIRSEDIAYYALGVMEGEPSADDIAVFQDQLAADPDATLIYDASYNAAVPFTQDGAYTLVTVAYDSDGNRVYADSYTFEATSVKKESNWVKRGVCEYTDGFMGLYKFQDQNGNPVDLGGLTWDVEYEENKEYPGYYRLVNPYTAWAYGVGATQWLQSGNYYITVNCVDPESCYLEYSPTGITINASNGMIIGYSLAYNELVGGATFDEVADLGYFGMLDAGELTFPTVIEQGEEYPTVCCLLENDNRIYFPESCYDFMIYFPELDKAPAHRVSAKKKSQAFRPGFSVTKAAMATTAASVERKSPAIKHISKEQSHRLFAKPRPAKF